MSLDYPDRAKWLARRNTPKNLWRKLGRVVWNRGTKVYGIKRMKREARRGE